MACLCALAISHACSPGGAAAPHFQKPSPGAALAPSKQSASQQATVALRLTSSVERLTDEPFWLIAELEAPKGAHLYWQNPGESGLATTARFAGEEGFEISEVRYPGPISFRSERGAVSYGYLERAGLMARVTSSSAARSASFSVTATWLSCGAVCVKETGTASIELDRDDRRVGERHLVREANLRTWLAKLPSHQAAPRVEWVSAEQVLLSSGQKVALKEYYPLETLGFDDRVPLSEPRGDGTLLVTLRRREPLPTHRGVVRGETEGRLCYFEVEFSRQLGDEPSVE